jgi:hypothetical protein
MVSFLPSPGGVGKGSERERPFSFRVAALDRTGGINRETNPCQEARCRKDMERLGKILKDRRRGDAFKDL